MREFDFDALHEQLLECGIRPDCARRAASEMRDHFDDLVDERTAGGAPEDVARRDAAAALGTVEHLVASMSGRRELKTWIYRYPLAAILFYPLACLVAIPATPVIAGIANAPVLARWSMSLVAAGVLTATLLLTLQLLILFG
ncbi:MAG: permease prefix domain 1-containing protein [Proteobacteria bacterium]|nr:permease prefix domain 1-containing protein [Pseudomonadota bacterium]